MGPKKESDGRAARGDNVNVGKADGNQKKKRIKIDKTLLPRGRGSILLSAALEKASLRKVETLNKKEPCASVALNKANSGQNDLKEIKVSSIKRDEGKGMIGAGTFGNCYLARFRGLQVVLKEFRQRSNTSVENSKLRQEAAYEARVVQRLGDHPGIPLLFGVMLQQPVVGIVFQFHGENDRSLTLYKAAKEKKIHEKASMESNFRKSS